MQRKLGDLPSISVVVPAFNGGRHLAMTLDSVAAQSVPLLDVVVVDDGSTDGTDRIVAAHPVGARLVTQANAGNAVARNRGALEAKGEWIAFVDQDDLWHRQHVERTLAVALDQGTACAASATISFVIDGEDEGGRASWADTRLTQEQLPATLQVVLPDLDDCQVRLLGPLDVAVAGAPVPSAVVVRRDTLLAAGGFPSVFAEPADLVCWFQVSRLTPLAVVDDATVLYRTHAAAASEGSEKELRALAAFTAIFYGNRLSPHRGGGDHAALIQHGRTNAVHKLRYLLSDAGQPGEAWRLRVAGAFESMLVDDSGTRRLLAAVRRKRRLEQAAPRVAGAGRSVMRAGRRLRS